MVRRSTYDQHGGYREDDDFAYGWEDWEFWLRLAEAGEHGVHVPQMEDDWRKGQARLRYEEAFVLQVELARRRDCAGT